MVTYTFTPDKASYRPLSKIYIKERPAFRKRKHKLILSCILSLIVIAMSVAGILLGRSRDNQWLVFLAIGISMFFIGLYLLVFGTRKQVLKENRQNGRFTENLEWTCTFDDYITIHTEKADSSLTWDMIEKWGEMDNYLYLQLGNSFILMDEDKLTEAEVAEIKGRLRDEGSD